MAAVDKKIERFIAKHHVLTLATATEQGEPYCCNCFYAYDAESAAFIFTTDVATHHGDVPIAAQKQVMSDRHSRFRLICPRWRLFPDSQIGRT